MKSYFFTERKFHVLRLMEAGKSKTEVAEVSGVDAHAVNGYVCAAGVAFNVTFKC